MPRRRDDEDEDEYDDNDDLPSIRKDKLDRSSLWSVAVYQKGILLCILVYILCVIIQFFLPTEIRWLLALVAFPTVLGATVFVFLLSTKVYSPGLGVLLGILTLIPCIGLLASEVY